MNSAVMAAISTAVFNMLNIKPPMNHGTWCPVDAGPFAKFNGRG
jgi:hypothetical protein